jgi:hypothetical protein
MRKKRRRMKRRRRRRKTMGTAWKIRAPAGLLAT